MPIHCRRMTEGDARAAVVLLCEGFKERDAGYWEHAIATLRDRAVPDGYPRYGYVLERGGRLVGILLTIFTATKAARAPIRCNLSSWYVAPGFTQFATLLMNAVIKKYDEVVFVNVSAARHTRAIIEASGFTRYAQGAFYAFPSIAAPVRGLTIIERTGSGPGPSSDLLAAHAGYGCISLVCIVGGQTYPFVFLRRRLARGTVACAQLIYCETIARFVAFAGPIGRFLLRRGMAFVILDANAAIPGLTGRYLDGRMPKYSRGPEAPRLGDLAYTEMVLFGP